MRLRTEYLVDLINDIDNENPESYDYGWNLADGISSTAAALKLDTLPAEIRRGWWLYREKNDDILVYEINN